MKLGALVLLVLSSLSPLGAYARCEPRPSVVDERYLRGWPIIMYGLVIEAHQDTSAQYNSYAVLELGSIWQGNPPNPVHVYHSDSAHGYTFEEGKSYLVFAYEEQGRIEASICSPTCVDAQCTQAFRLLGEPVQRLRSDLPFDIDFELQHGSDSVETFVRGFVAKSITRSIFQFVSDGVALLLSEHRHADGLWNAFKGSTTKALDYRYGLAEPIYIGDTEGDRLAADAAHVDFGHVSYGFGRVADATVIFSSFGELVAWFQKTAGA